MTWHKLIERTKKEVSYRLGNHSHREAENRVIVIKINMLVNDDGTPICWTVESKSVEPQAQVRELANPIDILSII